MSVIVVKHKGSVHLAAPPLPCCQVNPSLPLRFVNTPHSVAALHESISAGTRAPSGRRPATGQSPCGCYAVFMLFNTGAVGSHGCTTS